MRILPDSHTLLWWLRGSSRLSHEARELMNDDGNPLFYSAVTLWEIRIKQALGKLERMEDFEHFADADMAVTHLAVTHAHAEAAAALPLHHRDPFDRMLIAQAQIEDAVIVTTDPAFAAYDVRTAW